MDWYNADRILKFASTPLVNRTETVWAGSSRRSLAYTS